MTVVTLAEGKEHLNIAAGVTTYDTELTKFLDAAEGTIVARVGPLASASATVRVDGGGRRGLVLPFGGIQSVQAVVPVNGSALTLADLHIDTRTGVIEYNDGSFFVARAYDVTYTEGYATIPGPLRTAVLEVLRKLWDTQRGGGASRIGSGSAEVASNTLPDTGDELPFNVQRMIAPYRRIGVA